jgi:hypothetical protein
MNNSPAAIAFALNTTQWDALLDAEASAVRHAAGVQDMAGPLAIMPVQERKVRVYRPSNHLVHGALRSAIAALVLHLPAVVGAFDATTRQESWSKLVEGVSVAVGAGAAFGGIRAVIINILESSKGKIFEMMTLSNSLEKVVKIIVSPSDIDSG